MDAISALAKDERTARIILAVGSDPGDAVTGRLIGKLGAVETVRLLATSADLQGIDAAESGLWRHRVAAKLTAGTVERALEQSEQLGLRVIIPGDAEWPEGLGALGPRSPVALWSLGNAELLREPLTGLVTLTGARASSAYGEHVAAELSSGIVASGKAVVSGGAYGIDAASHRGALAAGGTTVAVLAGGLDRPYPSGNQGLFERIRESGLLLSEAAPGQTPTRWRFLERGRVLAALGGATVVVEAGGRSGSLNTAAHAHHLGRPVGTVPGPVTSATSAGPHRLLRDGTASVVENASDVTTLLSRHAPGLDRAAEAFSPPLTAAEHGQSRSL